MDSRSDISSESEGGMWAAGVGGEAIDASELARVVDADDVDAAIDTDREITRVVTLPLPTEAQSQGRAPLPRPRSLIPADILLAIAAEEEAMLSHDEQMAHAAEVVEELLLVDDASVDVLSEKVDRETAFNLLTHCEILRSVPHDALFELAIGAQRHHLTDRSQAFAEGAPADSFFVVESGALEMVRGANAAREVSISRLSVGQPFGLFGLLSQGSRSATVRSLGTSAVVEISGAKLESVLRSSPEARSIFARYFKERLLENFVGSGPLFAGLDSLGRAALISHFQDRLVPANDLLVAPGEVQSSIVLVTSGTVRVVLRSSGSQNELARLGRGDFFVVTSAFSGTPAQSSIVASEAASVCVLPQVAFNDFVKGYPALRNITANLDRTAKRVDRDLYVGNASQLAG